MEHIFGVISKKEGNIINEIPIFVNEESTYSLASIFLEASIYVEKKIELSTLNEERKEWLQLTKKERDSLIYNHAKDSIKVELIPSNFKAIHLFYDDAKKQIIYSNKYRNKEHWVDINTISLALYKVKEALYEDLKQSIQDQKNDNHKKASFDNIQQLLSIITTLKEICQADQIALVYCFL